MQKTAIVIGATGLVGGHLNRQLVDSERYGLVRVFTRRTTGIDDGKLEEHLVNFDEIETWRGAIQGDELFSALGTTLKRAGSKEAQYRVDFTYQYDVARAAARNGVGKYLLVSSAGADPDSRIFYSRMKGELEEAVEELSFESIVIFRPSVLAGEREETRVGEKLGGLVLGALARFVPPVRKYRPVPGATVARAMIAAASRTGGPRVETYELAEIFSLAEDGTDGAD
ncbi:MAG: NAD(P)H-binding protein [Gemmatimonadetes bacterium]|uniref:NAD(P)H-binding protein n=1 Tax=Candidatus Kutchimonas denitrificans TaxID=3056748 RepID=A0AAE4Z7U3_9BACT|nr:NAD(P)H-binding protein [Gemmatimonadota bacterium]NIR75399.1 NAD(P)H-binding protein [Candidatus Kutchimonas denitrificans]NIS01713.1 NAD(P)H-binding protein [Gemmatimonadota bacterium]NIT67495.1 NAD(P)H-binding protein [Gemmatimonadota bacterium]NIU53358.1 NAD(P)H-binding protein [Gemmatimonadota bacterium]